LTGRVVEATSFVRSNLSIAIDFAPMLPGGTAGGVKVLALNLVHRFRRLAPEHRVVLLSSRRAHAELQSIAPAGVELLTVWPGGVMVPSPGLSFLPELGNAFRRFSPIPSRSRRTAPGRRLRRRGIDLLFCPFTAPTFAERDVPIVSILHDLQHLAYPEFFDPREVAGRNEYLAQLQDRADIVVCVSEHARATLLERVGFPVDRTRVVPIAVHDRLREQSADEVNAVRSRLGLRRDYIFYPANGWPHKNHRTLLEAFRLLRSRSSADVDLVLSGVLDDVRADLDMHARALGLGGHIHWVGYCSDETLAAIYQGCRMLIFPSLYEGFGIPVLEAMRFGRPVACSNSTSLPEVGGDAALYFDPGDPAAIALSMEEVLMNPSLAHELSLRGRARAASFSGDGMATAYLRLFAEIAGTPARNN
jgi:glycosyltransferase involved in cell wall biosynthesis